MRARSVLQTCSVRAPTVANTPRDYCSMFSCTERLPLPPPCAFRTYLAEQAHVRPLRSSTSSLLRQLLHTAIRAFYTCDKQSWPPSQRWWQPECSQGFEESLLFRYLHAAEVPYRFYSMFEYAITRGELGGVCESGTTVYFDVCNLMVKGFKAPTRYDGYFGRACDLLFVAAQQ